MIKITNDTSTLSGSLAECKDQLISELANQGVTATFNPSTGLLGLIHKISEIDTGGTITLATNKSILSYADTETATLTATHSQGAGKTVEIYNAVSGAKIGDATDNQDGTYSYTYNSTGVGDISMTAVSGQTESNSITIEDCLAYDTTFNDWTSITNKGTSYLFSDYTLPSTHRIEFKLKNNSGIRIACGDSSKVDGSGYLEWHYAYYNDTHTLYYYNPNYSNVKESSSNDTTSVFAIEYTGTSVKLFKNDVQLTTVSCVEVSVLSRLLRLNSNTVSNLDWIKVKPL